ncbi:hypothetical protein C1I98_18115 [Spongiactinospora gelatinilytica]|uniref:LysR substrate-binding domain-containing protein n=1 Tax=Spongiactinospora gelatinilytica TaxID=2666298 RepID=A0A2W2G759_9ACTN|nr:hypothetical protein C1I98_18115 [Spongiactinospora gelatinilytica]
MEGSLPHRERGRGGRVESGSARKRPATHRLAGKKSITPEDFAGEALVPCTGATAAWSGFWRLEPRPGGRPAPLGPLVVDTFEDKLELIADGAAVAVLPAGDRRGTLRDDLAVVPIDDAPPCQVAVITRAGDRDPLVVHFRESAGRFLTRAA